MTSVQYFEVKKPVCHQCGDKQGNILNLVEDGIQIY